VKRTPLKRKTPLRVRARLPRKARLAVTRRAVVSRRKGQVPPATRAAVRKRAGNQCERCPSRRDLQVHHRKLKSQGGTHAIDNLALLCSSCHDHVHNVDRAGARRDGWIIDSKSEARA